MNSYETYIDILQNISTDLGVSFAHGRYEDLNTYQGDFPLIWCLPLSYSLASLQSSVFSAGFSTSLIFFVKSDENIDRTMQTDLERIYQADEIVSNFVKILQEVEGLSFQTAQAQAYPLENSSSFVLTAITLNLEVKTTYNINYCL